MKTLRDILLLLDRQFFVHKRQFAAQLIVLFGRRILDEGYETFPGFDGLLAEIERLELSHIPENHEHGIIVSTYVLAVNNLYQSNFFLALHHLAHIADLMDQGIHAQKECQVSFDQRCERTTGIQIVYNLFEKMVNDENLRRLAETSE